MSGLGIDWKILIGQLINFAILFFLLKRFAYKPFLNLLKKRREAIEEGAKKAQEAQASLLRVRDMEVEARQVGERAAREMVKTAQIVAEKKKEVILASAEKEKERIINQARETAEREANEKKEAHRKEVLDRSFILAEKFLKEKFDKDADEKFMKKLISDKA